MKYEIQEVIETKVNNITVVKRLKFKDAVKRDYMDLAKSYDLGEFEGTETSKGYGSDGNLQNVTINTAKIMVGSDKQPIGGEYKWQ